MQNVVGPTLVAMATKFGLALTITIPPPEGIVIGRVCWLVS